MIVLTWSLLILMTLCVGVDCFLVYGTQWRAHHALEVCKTLDLESLITPGSAYGAGPGTV